MSTENVSDTVIVEGLKERLDEVIRLLKVLVDNTNKGPMLVTKVDPQTVEWEIK